MRFKIYKDSGEIEKFIFIKNPKTNKYSLIDISKGLLYEDEFKSVEELFNYLRDLEDVNKYIITDWQKEDKGV